MGRASKLTPETVTKIEDALATGATYKLAAMYAGVAESTLHAWRAQKTEYSERLTRAEGRAAIALLRLIDTAAKEDWRAAAWKLERRYPQDYGRTVQEVTGLDGGAIALTVTDARERLRSRITELAPRARTRLLPEPTGEDAGASGAA